MYACPHFPLWNFLKKSIYIISGFCLCAHLAFMHKPTDLSHRPGPIKSLPQEMKSFCNPSISFYMGECARSIIIGANGAGTYSFQLCSSISGLPQT